MNLYLYCRAGPVTYVDPDGLDVTDAKSSVPRPDGPQELSHEEALALISDPSPLAIGSIGEAKQRSAGAAKAHAEARLRTGELQKQANEAQAAEDLDTAVRIQAEYEATLHQSVTNTGYGEDARSGALGAVLGQIVANKLFDDVDPNAHDFSAAVRAAAVDAASVSHDIFQPESAGKLSIRPNEGLESEGDRSPRWLPRRIPLASFTARIRPAATLCTRRELTWRRGESSSTLVRASTPPRKGLRPSAGPVGSLAPTPPWWSFGSREQN